MNETPYQITRRDLFIKHMIKCFGIRWHSVCDKGKIKKKTKVWTRKHEEQMANQEERLKAAVEKLENTKRKLETKKNQGKDVSVLKKRIKRQREAVTRQKQRIKDMKAKQRERMAKLKQSLENRKHRDIASVEKMKVKITVQEETRDYNISTSLKSYIDPRIYYEWGKQVEYDWKQYYQKALHKKFSWLDCQDDKAENS